MFFPIIVAIILEFALRGAVATAQALPLITVQDIEIVGNTVFDAELEAIVAPVKGQKIPLEQILELRDKLTNYYVAQGYTSSGAFLPQFLL